MSVLRRLVLAQHAGSEASEDPHGDPVLSREWLVTNGMGGYASGTVSGAVTRRFHGALIASLPAPLGRMMMLNHLAEQVHLEGAASLELGAQKRPARAGAPAGQAALLEFLTEDGLPVWHYDLGQGRILEKRLVMPHGQNTVLVTYALSRGPGPVRVAVEPWLNFRPHEGSLGRPLGDDPYAVTEQGEHYEVAAPGLPVLRLRVDGPSSTFQVEGRRIHGIVYGIEASRGYDATGDLYAPGSFRSVLGPGQCVTLTASTEPWEVIDAMTPALIAKCEAARRTRLLAWAPAPLRSGIAGELVLAADQFIVEPPGRVDNRTVTYACGDEPRSVIAGYHWFTDWGRDTMIGLEGLTLSTGRHADARDILGTFSRYVRDGLLPNLFPEGKGAGLYHTADATLWFFHAIDRYFEHTGDRGLVASLLPILVSIAEFHQRGTRFGIGVDPRDGLLTQGTPDLPLTWMDAKVGDLVVTPRRGKAVELNALYFNALRLLASWLELEGDDAGATTYRDRASRLQASFNQRFWYAKGGYLYDIVDGDAGDDTLLRPNQLLAVSLRHPVLDEKRWAAVVSCCEQRLVTPMGLRSLAPGEPDYKPCYFGDLRARDLAYHQGTVWAWLIGPFVDAWLKVHPGREREAMRFLSGFVAHLDEGCIGSVSEIFDAEAPYTPRGCIAQAWSVAEVLRLLAVLGAAASARETPRFPGPSAGHVFPS